MKNTDFTPYLTMTSDELRKRQWTKGWALSLVGLIVYGVLRLFRQKPKDYKGICPYFEIGKKWGGLEMGWFFICGKNCSDALKRHEIGHSIQNAAVGGLKMLWYSTCSAIRYWWRKIKKPKTSYNSWWFEKQATEIGRAYVNQIIEENR